MLEEDTITTVDLLCEVITRGAAIMFALFVLFVVVRY